MWLFLFKEHIIDPTTVQQNVNNAQAAGDAQQQALNTQSNQLQSNYGHSVDAANNARNNATTLNNNIENGGTLYGQNLNDQMSKFGFNPQTLTAANQNLTAMQNQVAYAPTSAQQTGNYYGTTAGGTGNIYSGLMANLNPGLTNASNTAGNLSNEYGLFTNAANQQAGLTVQSQQNKAANAQTQYANSVQQMQTAGATMAAIENLRQQQGVLTAQQVTAYQNAYSQYINAQAAATSANASAALANSQTSAQALSNQQAKNALAVGTTPNNVVSTFGGNGNLQAGNNGLQVNGGLQSMQPSNNIASILQGAR